MRPAVLGLALLALAARTATAQPDSAARRPFSFAVLGHIRGDASGKLNPKLGELLTRVRALQPEFVVLTGDIVFGDYTSVRPDTAQVRRQWEEVDSALTTLGIPVYRVPGNHDISSVGTKQLWWQRYGALPQVVQRHGARLLLLGSPWIPADDDTVRQVVSRPLALDSAQTAWLRAQLAGPPVVPTFVLMHHLLWWDGNAPWWKEIHPLLHAAGVRAVFSGDLGPLKFSHLERDSVQYVQGSLEGLPSLGILQSLETSRILSAQFDNFLFVRVDGAQADISVHTLGEFGAPQYTPSFYQDMMNPPRVSPWRQAKDILGLRRIALALGATGALALGLGWLLGRARYPKVDRQ